MAAAKATRKLLAAKCPLLAQSRHDLAPHMSASDPKRTIRLTNRSRNTVNHVVAIAARIPWHAFKRLGVSCGIAGPHGQTKRPSRSWSNTTFKPTPCESFAAWRKRDRLPSLEIVGRELHR